MPTATKTQTNKPQTQFPTAMPWPNHFWPSRERIQECVDDIDRAKATTLIQRYRELERIACDNDISGFSATIAACERDKDDVRAEQCRRAREKANHDLFVDSQDKLHALREQAADMATPLLRRVYASLDDELREYAVAREASLQRLGIPIYVDRPARGGEMVINGARVGTMAREWKLVSDAETTAYYAPRNAVGNLIELFEKGWRGYTAGEIRHERGVRTLQYLCTSETVSDFSWQ
jgi:hypothetical protein